MQIPETQASKEAALSLYSALKSASQITTYIGIASTALLSVYDLLHKEMFEPEQATDRAHMNRAGPNTPS